ncbi:gamma-glutamyltransferase family protein [Heyndrickxia acidicola]|uniref:Gamma-glutamyltransferase family protein n=1 Tax=Heyndrickxia acidicola TaxID=209389 RepID=A0ABU6MH71_9BACI|nr:gamma-glutamyltransferase family protein [Heyndrickxia acidicola]MED1202622.1 gamma-glutamyltransferase family protein [Heyndrickxia acidicola]
MELKRSCKHAPLDGGNIAESFYLGELARKIVSFSKQYKGFLSADDLAQYHPEWVQPISVNYRGYDVKQSNSPKGTIFSISFI